MSSPTRFDALPRDVKNALRRQGTALPHHVFGGGACCDRPPVYDVEDGSRLPKLLCAACFRKYDAYLGRAFGARL